ncbi:biotin carboxylase [Rhizobium leguminosarum]|uniref:biotin carboxylase n=1 Tax=Rhizobium leguminosarum TaxID=384 RepID=UPI0003818A9C|nr:biotin carboxylase [Rhizobium leguminosarum]
MKTIRIIAELRDFMRRNERPIYFVSASPFNLMGIDEWVGNFKFISYIDPFDGRHPNVFVPSKIPGFKPKSIEDITNHLLQHPEVSDYITRRGGRPVAVFLMFDENTEALCQELGIEVWHPTARLRQRCDNKIETVRIGNKAGVRSVPNALGPARTYEELLSSARKAGLGDDLVVQTAFGDSGRTTYFIASEGDYKRRAAQFAAEDEVKIMKRINCRGATIEACITTSGTFVSPLMTEIIGKPELTPYKGGWAGNEIFAGAFSEEICVKARDMTTRLGDQLFREGYRGCFNVDLLVDPENNEVYLGELNPRISGASPLANQAAFAYADAPLAQFHLMEFSGIDNDIDVKELNDRWARAESIDSWSNLILKSTGDVVGIVTHAPASGIYRMAPDGSVSYDRFDYRRQAIESDEEAFFLRIAAPGDSLCKGDYLGILMVRGQVMDEFELNDRARNWIKGIKRLYVSKPATEIQCDEAKEPIR